MISRWIAIAGVLALLMVGCAATEEVPDGEAAPDDADEQGESPAVAGEPIKIGFLAATSGVFATVGEQMENGLRFYIEEQGGELAGRPVEIITRDTEANPEVGLRRAQELIEQEEVDFVTGVVSSAVGVGIRDLFDESDVPLIISNSNVTGLNRELLSSRIFRVSPSFYQQGIAPGEWFYENVAQEDVIIVTSDFVGGHDYAEAFRESFEEAGGTILDEIYTPFQTTEDYQPFLSQIVSAEPQAVMAFYGGGEAISFVTQYADFGLAGEIPLYGFGSMTDETVLPAIGEAALGVRTLAFYTWTQEVEGNAPFVEAFRERFNEVPTYFSVGSYDAAHLIHRALEQVDGNTDDIDALIAALENPGELTSPSGFFEMDPDTHNAIRQFHMREVVERDGELINEVIADLGVHAEPGA